MMGFHASVIEDVQRGVPGKAIIRSSSGIKFEIVMTAIFVIAMTGTTTKDCQADFGD